MKAYNLKKEGQVIQKGNKCMGCVYVEKGKKYIF